MRYVFKENYFFLKWSYAWNRLIILPKRSRGNKFQLGPSSKNSIFREFKIPQEIDDQSGLAYFTIYKI